MVKQVNEVDANAIANLMAMLWPHHTPKELEAEVVDSMKNGGNAYFLKYACDMPVGFAYCSLRQDYVEGTESSPVGYLEGIYILEPHRNRGYAKELLVACEAWAKEQGCQEFASDCELENRESQLFHKALGFREANRIICFAKRL